MTNSNNIPSFGQENTSKDSSLSSRTYDLEIVDSSKRTSSAWDSFATWVAANANNGTWYIGGVIAACGFGGAIAHLTVSSIISYIFLMLIGYMGYKVGSTTMGAARAAFGIRGSYVPSVVNLVQYIGWTAVNTFIAATSVSFLLSGLFGWPVYGEPGGLKGLIVGILVMSILHIISVSTGVESVRMIERVGIVLVAVFAIWETVVVFQSVSFNQIIAWNPPAGQALSSGRAIDSLAAFNMGWVTCAADFTRFSKSKGGATSIPFLGALVGVFWFAFVGLTATISIAVTSGTYDANNSDPSTIASKLGLGTIALIVVILTSMTANAVNLTAAGSSLTNIVTKLKLTPSLWIVTIGATLMTFIPVVMGSFLDSFTLFLDYIGMALGPIIIIMIVDFYLLHHARYDAQELIAKNGMFWYRSGINWIAISCWASGIVTFLILQHIPFIGETIGATFLNMAIVGCAYAFAMKISARSNH